MEPNNHSSQRGQSLVLMALMALALVGMLALVVDGGYGYAKRRAAQVAADAGALAGATELCNTHDAMVALDRAQEYTLDRNRAVEADIIISGGLVTVTARIPFQTFFAGAIGQPQVTAAATAVAGCFCPGVGTGVSPIAWACQPPAGLPGTEDCAMKFGTLETPGPLYIIMDSKTVDQDFYCQTPPNSGIPAGTLDCDVDNDGINDLLASGNRSWLDLDGGGGGSSEMSNWIRYGFPGEVFIHTWFGGQPGTDNSVFQTAEEREGDIVLIPVFDSYCEGIPNIDCAAYYHSGPDPADRIIYGGGAKALYYHVISFAAFKITCVDAPGAPPPPGGCPGRNAAKAANPGIKPPWGSLKTIEGYFIEGYVPGLGGRPGTCVDAGAFTIYLLR